MSGNYQTLLGAEDVRRAGHDIAASAEAMQRAADTVDRAADYLARTMDEAVTRFVGNLAEHDAERPTLRDYFAAKAMQGLMSRDDWTDKDFSGEALAAYRAADAMLKARQS